MLDLHLVLFQEKQNTGQSHLLLQLTCIATVKVKAQLLLSDEGAVLMVHRDPGSSANILDSSVGCLV
jgi:hypothetical protein